MSEFRESEAIDTDRRASTPGSVRRSPPDRTGRDSWGRRSLAGVSDPSELSSLSPPGRLTLLSVHAHPDDEASKGAPTIALYHAEGIHTVLVCCTGGEEGDLQNPSLREPGQPFHGLTPEEEKAKVVALRPSELEASAKAIGFDEVVMLGYRDSGMPDTPANEHPDSFHQADLDEAVGRLVEAVPADAAASHPHLRGRPADLPAPRPPAGARRLGTRLRASGRP